MNLNAEKEINVIEFLELESTNKYCVDNISSLKDKDIVTASVQTFGRGRLNRHWISENSSNLYFSIVLKESLKKDIDSEIYSNITQLIALEIVKSLNDYGVSAKIKWPNDILLNGKKIAGILSQVEYLNGKINSMVVGVGINFDLDDSEKDKIDRPATSILEETGQYIDKNKFLKKICFNFFKNYKGFIQKGFGSIYDEFNAVFDTVNKRVRVKLITEEFEAYSMGIDKKGKLLIKRDNGNIETLTIGDIL